MLQFIYGKPLIWTDEAFWSDNTEVYMNMFYYYCYWIFWVDILSIAYWHLQSKKYLINTGLQCSISAKWSFWHSPRLNVQNSVCPHLGLKCWDILCCSALGTYSPFFTICRGHRAWCLWATHSSWGLEGPFHPWVQIWRTLTVRVQISAGEECVGKH